MDELTIVSAGNVVEARSDKPLVKVNILGRTTTWLPVLQTANSFKKKFVPMGINEQVIVLANRYVIGSIFNHDCSEPVGVNEHIEITEYSDGTRIEYDTQSHALTVKCAGKTRIESVDIELAGNITLIGDVQHQGAFSNTDGITTDGSISDSKGDLTSHGHVGASPR